MFRNASGILEASMGQGGRREKLDKYVHVRDKKKLSEFSKFLGTWHIHRVTI